MTIGTLPCVTSAITLRVYAHVIRAAETAAAEVFARVMSEAT